MRHELMEKSFPPSLLQEYAGRMPRASFAPPTGGVTGRTSQPFAMASGLYPGSDAGGRNSPAFSGGGSGHGSGGGSPNNGGGNNGEVDPLMERFTRDALEAVLSLKEKEDAEAGDGDKKAMVPRDGEDDEDKKDDDDDDAETTKRREADFARARRYRQILRLLHSPKMRAAIENLKSKARVILMISALFYLAAIITISVLIQIHKGNMDVVVLGSEFTTESVHAAIIARTLEVLSYNPPLHIANEDVTSQAGDMLALSDAMDAMLHTMHVRENSGAGAKLNKPPKAVEDLLEAKTRNIVTFFPWLNRTGGTFQNSMESAWDAANVYVSNMRAVGFEPQNRSQMALTMPYRYLVDNGITTIVPAFREVQAAETKNADEFLHLTADAQLILLLLNAALFVWSVWYYRRLLSRVAFERVNLFTVFLAVPKNVVLKLAMKSIKVSEDEDESDDDSDDDDDWNQRILLQQQQHQKEKEEEQEAMAREAERRAPPALLGAASNPLAAAAAALGARMAHAQAAPADQPHAHFNHAFRASGDADQDIRPNSAAPSDLLAHVNKLYDEPTRLRTPPEGLQQPTGDRSFAFSNPAQGPRAVMEGYESYGMDESHGMDESYGMDDSYGAFDLNGSRGAEASPGQRAGAVMETYVPYNAAPAVADGSFHSAASDELGLPTPAAAAAEAAEAEGRRGMGPRSQTLHRPDIASGPSMKRSALTPAFRARVASQRHLNVDNGKRVVMQEVDESHLMRPTHAPDAPEPLMSASGKSAEQHPVAPDAAHKATGFLAALSTKFGGRSDKSMVATAKEGGRPSLAPSAADTEVARMAKKLHTKHQRRLDQRGAASYYFVLPLVLWGMLCIAGFAVSYTLLEDTRPSITDVRIASRSFSLLTRVRFFAQELVVVPVGSPESAYAPIREKLTISLHDFSRHYYGVLYGDDELGTHGSMLSSTARDAVLFKPQCFATKEPCTPDGHPWAPRKLQGLDNLVRFFIEEVEVLAIAPAYELTPDNPHFGFVWEAGHSDLHDGMLALVEIYNAGSYSLPQTADNIIIAIFVFVMVANILFFFRYFRPWLARTLSESKRVAELLSELPKEMNIDALIHGAEQAHMNPSGAPEGSASTRSNEASRKG